MNLNHYSFSITCEARTTFHDITDEITKYVHSLNINNGIVFVYSQHTTCSVLIQEQSDDVNYYGEQLINQDLINVLSKIIPTCETQGQYLHPGPKHIEIAIQERGEEPWWSLNTDAHLRSVLLGRSVTIPIINGKPILGQFGRVYFADLDQTRTRERTVRICVLG